MNLALKLKHAFLLLVLCGILFRPTPILAGVIFESGTLGPTGITQSDLSSGLVPSTIISPSVYTGVRFQLDRKTITERIGGHFVSGSSGTFFGAIIELDAADDTPDSFDFTTSDFLGATTLVFPVESDEVYGDLALSLDPGWYALVFGSGVFGTNGNGNAVRNGTDIDNPSYIAAQPFSGISGWFNIGTFPNHRFVLKGQVVPEPSAIVFGALSLFCLLLRRRL